MPEQKQLKTKITINKGNTLIKKIHHFEYSIP